VFWPAVAVDDIFVYGSENNTSGSQEASFLLGFQLIQLANSQLIHYNAFFLALYDCELEKGNPLVL
jgi:hypothetical protein